MSYIDREEATDYFMKLAIAGKLTDDKYAEGLTYAFLTAAHYVQNLAPDADVEPIRHGEWVHIDTNDEDSDVRCTNCNEVFNYIDGVCYLVLGTELPRYCPNCGALMDMGET